MKCFNLPSFTTNETLVILEGSRADTILPASKRRYIRPVTVEDRHRFNTPFVCQALGQRTNTGAWSWHMIEAKESSKKNFAQASRMLQAQPHIRSVTDSVDVIRKRQWLWHRRCIRGAKRERWDVFHVAKLFRGVLLSGIS
jgi:hypothetical protein